MTGKRQGQVRVIQSWKRLLSMSPSNTYCYVLSAPNPGYESEMDEEEEEGDEEEEGENGDEPGKGKDNNKDAAGQPQVVR